MEKLLESIEVYGNTCCVRKPASVTVMIAIRDRCDLATGRVTELFLTTEQAEKLVADITERLRQNREDK